MDMTFPTQLHRFWRTRSTPRQDRATTLALLAECLAVGENYAPGLSERLTAATVDWRGLCWLAGCHLVTPSLAGALQRKGLFDQLPLEVQDYLATLQDLNRERNQTLREQLVIIADALNRIGIQPVLLKGAITLTSGQYPGAEDRVLGDLDLLVPNQYMDIATKAIKGLGYQIAEPVFSPWALPGDLKQKNQPDHDHHERPLFHPTLPVKVELHRRILADQKDDAYLREAMKVKPFNFVEGSIVLIPDSATRVLHNLLHSQITDKQRLKKILNLRQILEFAALAHHYAAELDTDSLLNRLRTERQPVLAEYWAQAERWLKVSYPESLPRSPHEAINLWLLERVATQPFWFRLFMFIEGIPRLPRRLSDNKSGLEAILLLSGKF